VTIATVAGGLLIVLGVAMATGTLEAGLRALVDARERRATGIDPRADAG
jgi:hypothetical protein